MSQASPAVSRRGQYRNPAGLASPVLHARPGQISAPVLYRAGLLPGPACEACGAGGDYLVPDHCHRHGWVRGTLCRQCNAHMSLLDGAASRQAIASWPAGRLETLTLHWLKCPECQLADFPSVSALAGQGRTAYTWRRTPEQALAMDELTLRLKRHLGLAKLDHAAILVALVDLAMGNPMVFGALATQLQDKQDRSTQH